MTDKQAIIERMAEAIANCPMEDDCKTMAQAALDASGLWKESKGRE